MTAPLAGGGFTNLTTPNMIFFILLSGMFWGGKNAVKSTG